MIEWLLSEGRIVWLAIALLVAEYAFLRGRIADRTYLWTTLSGLALMLALYGALTGWDLLVMIALTAGFAAHCMDVRGRLSG